MFSVPDGLDVKQNISPKRYISYCLMIETADILVKEDKRHTKTWFLYFKERVLNTCLNSIRTGECVYEDCQSGQQARHYNYRDYRN